MMPGAVPAYARSYVSRRPSYLIFYVTSRCNLRCGFCFYADALNAPWGDGMSLPEIERFARSLGHCVQVTLTGGEPFLRRDLDQIVAAFVRHAGARNITIATHGGFTERIVDLVQRVLPAYPELELRLAFSIDGVGAHHDAVRGQHGAFERVVRSVREAHKLQAQFPNLHVVVTTVASRLNKEHLVELFDFVAQHLTVDDHALLLARGKTRDESARDISPDEFRALVAAMEARTPQRAASRGAHARLLGHIEREIRHVAARTYETGQWQLPCVAGGKFLVVYESGEVFPCEILDTMDHPAEVVQRFGGSFRLGNLRDTGFDVRPLLDDQRAQAIRRYISESRCHCTFECAIAASMVFQPATLLRSLVRRPSTAT